MSESNRHWQAYKIHDRDRETSSKDPYILLDTCMKIIFRQTSSNERDLTVHVF
jgi:hypothetical protein